jgi:hypothetical protein
MSHLSSKLFNYDHETNTFTAWASELGPQPFRQIFDDACDEGCSIVSVISGQIADFYVTLEEKDAERNVTAWHLDPTAATVRRLPLTKDAKIVIFND